jgi:hypothetical protein
MIHRTKLGRAVQPAWLVILAVEQLLGYRAGDAQRKVGGLILEARGDFCAHVRTILERHGRGADYVEISLESPYRYVPAVTIRDLLKASLRLRPDRIVVGEVRGGEAFDLLQALNTGHDGSLSTVHANSANAALERLASCVLQNGIDLRFAAARRAIGEVIDVVLHVERSRGARCTRRVCRETSPPSATATGQFHRMHAGTVRRRRQLSGAALGTGAWRSHVASVAAPWGVQLAATYALQLGRSRDPS